MRRFVASCCDSNFDTVTMPFGATLADIQKRRLALGARKTNNRMDRDRSVRCNAAGIWVLTEQNAVETSLLSESTARVVEGQATGVQAADATGEAQTENGMTGGADSAASNVRSGRLASIRMWVGTNVRRVAHTVEFFFVGLFASVVVVCFSRRPWSVCSRCVPVLLFCAACSVGDQVHKIFVPGRHFDVIDLGFDAAGYVTAMLLVLLAAALVRHATRPIGAHARR